MRPGSAGLLRAERARRSVELWQRIAAENWELAGRLAEHARQAEQFAADAQREADEAELEGGER